MIIHSPYDDVALADVPVAAYVLERAADRAAKPASLQLSLNLSLRESAAVVAMSRLDLAGFVRTVQDYGVTRTEVVPPIVLALAKQPAVGHYDQAMTAGRPQ